MPQITIPLTIADSDATATIDYRITYRYRVTYRGAPQTHTSPAEAMEYDQTVTRLVIHQKDHSYRKTQTINITGDPIPSWLQMVILHDYEDDIYSAIEREEGELGPRR